MGSAPSSRYEGFAKSPMILKPHWVVPPSIQSAYTTRQGGVSVGEYDSFNLGMHVGDNPEHVAQNRKQLKEALQLKQDPTWLTQVHGSNILDLDFKKESDANLEYDASFSTQPNAVCVVMTADCLPLLLCDEKGTAVAAVHCGWRSIAEGIIEKTIAVLRTKTNAPLIAWLGPAIGPEAFEVGEEVRVQFSHYNPDQTQFIPLSPKQRSDPHYLANIYKIATAILQAQGLLNKHIYQTSHCTYSNPDTFYSFRREGVTGRMASLIWIAV